MAENKEIINLSELVQDYASDTVREQYFTKAIPAERYFLGRAGDVIERLISMAEIFFIEIIEDVLGNKLYITQDESDELADIGPEIKKLAQGLIGDGIIKNIQYGIFFNDEPKIFRFSTSYGDFLYKNSDSGGPPSSGGGTSGSSFTDRSEALMKCLGEAMERTCGGFYKKKDLTIGSFDELIKRGLNAVDPETFSTLSEKQFLKNPRVSGRRPTRQVGMNWAWGKSLLTGKKILVPAQTVYVPYQYYEGEAFIRSNITTGAAVYTEKNEAIYRGLCEVIERDAFIISYLNKLPLPEVDLENSFGGELNPILKSIKRYNLEAHVLEITTDIPIPTFMTLIIDRTGFGPALTVGNKSDLDVKKAVSGSLVEALKTRPWVYRIMREKKPVSADMNDNITTLEHRALLWAPLDMIKKIEFFVGGKKKIINEGEIITDSGKKLEKALAYFKNNNMEVVAVDTTIPEVKKYGFISFTVISPWLHHMHLQEKYKCLAGKRLYEVPVKLGYFDEPKTEEGLNPIPHPFP